MKVIHSSELPSRLPVYQTISIYLLLVHFKAPSWLWGAMGVLLLIGWASTIYCICKQESVKILTKDEKL